MSWAPPIAEDNSGDVALLTNPVGISSPYQFQIGDTRINYTAADQANNTVTCSFTVNVQGASIFSTLNILARMTKE